MIGDRADIPPAIHELRKEGTICNIVTIHQRLLRFLGGTAGRKYRYKFRQRPRFGYERNFQKIPVLSSLKMTSRKGMI